MFAHMRLGRKSGPIPDKFPSLDGHKMRAMIAPAKLDRSHLPFEPRLDGNDVAGCCTWVAVSNAIRAQWAMLGLQGAIDTTAALRAYSRSSGYKPGDAASDTGEFETTVLREQAIGYEAGGPGPYCGLYGSIHPDDWNAQRLVMSRLGAVYLGVNLALADQAGGVWDTNTPGDQRPGSWGGHACLAWSYSGTEDTDLVMLATWGTLVPCTWRWLRSRVEEAHMLVHPQIVGPDRLTGAGIDRDLLAADMAAFAAS